MNTSHWLIQAYFCMDTVSFTEAWSWKTSEWVPLGWKGMKRFSLQLGLDHCFILIIPGWGDNSRKDALRLVVQKQDFKSMDKIITGELVVVTLMLMVWMKNCYTHRQRRQTLWSVVEVVWTNICCIPGQELCVQNISITLRMYWEGLLVFVLRLKEANWRNLPRLHILKMIPMCASFLHTLPPVPPPSVGDTASHLWKRGDGWASTQ